MSGPNPINADPQLIEKIKKLMRVDPERGSTPAEAEQALAMAQRLALKHGIDLGQLDTEEITAAGEPFEEVEFIPKRKDGIEVKTKLPVCHKWIAKILIRYFAVDIIYQTRYGKYKNRDGSEGQGFRKILLINGRKTNVQIAIYVYGFLFNEFNQRWEDHCKGQDMRALWAERNGFYYGLYLGLDAKLEKEKGRAEREIQAQLKAAKSNTCTSLIIQNEAEKLAAEVKNRHPRLKYFTVDNGPVGDWGTFEKGKKEGAKININPALK